MKRKEEIGPHKHNNINPDNPENRDYRDQSGIFGFNRV